MRMHSAGSVAIAVFCAVSGAVDCRAQKPALCRLLPTPEPETTLQQVREAVAQAQGTAVILHASLPSVPSGMFPILLVMPYASEVGVARGATLGAVKKILDQKDAFWRHCLDRISYEKPATILR